MRRVVTIFTTLAFGAALLAAPAAAAPQASADAPEEKLICKKQLETGSLVKKRKTCMTKAQWEKVASSQQDGSRRMIDELATRPAGGN